jgi:hypothetical protein
MLFDISGRRRRITAGRTTVGKVFFRPGKTARWTSDRGKEPPAMRAGLRIFVNFKIAVVTKKTGFFAHITSNFT